MADPTIINSSDMSAAAESTNAFGKALSGVHDSIASITPMVGKYVEELGNTTTMSEKSTNALGLMFASITKVGTAFNGLHNNTAAFTKQIEMFGSAIPQVVRNIISAADGGLKLQNSFLAASAATGNLSNVYAEAGPNLDNLNSILYKQVQAMNASQIATGLTSDEIESYYSKLAQIPGSLNSIVNLETKAGGSTNMLTAAIKYATGSGRDFDNVMQDLKNAFQDYGLTGENALRFSSKMGQVSNALGIDLASVQSHLTSTADAFKMFATNAENSIRMTDGLANITNKYVSALKATGLSGNTSIEVVKGLITTMSKLETGQKAFLSAQTGGPGGLMGSFQIEKMMREGKTSELFEKMRKQMGSQMGKIVSLDEAAADPAMAAQRVKQVALLRQGPMGSMAPDDATAGRILDAFQMLDQGKIKPEDLKDNILADTMDKGTAIAEKSYTELTKITALLGSQQRLGSMASLDTIQKGFTIGSGSGTGGDSADMIAYRDRQRMFMKGGNDYGTANMGSSDMAAYGVKSFYEALKSLPQDIKATIGGLGSAMTTGDRAGVQDRVARLEADKKKLEADKDLSLDKSKQILLAQENEWIKTGKDYLSGKSVALPTDYSKEYNPYQNMQSAATKSSNNKPEQGYSQQGVDGKVHVHVTGYCLKCKRDIEENPQLRTVNVAAQ